MKNRAEAVWKALHAIQHADGADLGQVKKIATYREVEFKGKVYRENSLLPEGAVRMNYSDAQRFLMTEIESVENRQVYFGNDMESIVYNLRIFWVDRDTSLGYGIADDLRTKRIVLYRFGKRHNWFLYKNKHRLHEDFQEDGAKESESVLLL